MRDKNTAAVLALFLGSLGVHRFYLGQPGWGILYALASFTFIPAVLGVVDFFRLIQMDQAEFDRRYNSPPVLAPPMFVPMLPPGAYGNYAPGPSPGPSQPPGPRPSRGPQTAEELAAALEKLNELRIAGLITEDEFATQKTRLLDRMF